LFHFVFFAISLDIFFVIVEFPFFYSPHIRQISVEPQCLFTDFLFSPESFDDARRFSFSSPSFTARQADHARLSLMLFSMLLRCCRRHYFLSRHASSIPPRRHCYSMILIRDACAAGFFTALIYATFRHILFRWLIDAIVDITLVLLFHIMRYTLLAFVFIMPLLYAYAHIYEQIPLLPISPRFCHYFAIFHFQRAPAAHCQADAAFASAAASSMIRQPFSLHFFFFHCFA
jgi:hypothetical protein